MTSQPTVFQFPSFSSAVHWTNLRLRLAACFVNFVASSNPAALGWSLTFLLQVALIKARRPSGRDAGFRCCRGRLSSLMFISFIYCEISTGNTRTNKKKISLVFFTTLRPWLRRTLCSFGRALAVGFGDRWTSSHVTSLRCCNFVTSPKWIAFGGRH